MTAFATSDIDDHPPVPHALLAPPRVGAAVLLLASSQLKAQQTLTLQQAIDRAQQQGLPARAALSARESARQRDRAYGADLLRSCPLRAPRPTTAARLSQSFSPMDRRCLRQYSRPPRPRASPFRKSFRSPGAASLCPQGSRGSSERRTGSAHVELDAADRELYAELVFRPNEIEWTTREQDLSTDASERQYLETRETIARCKPRGRFSISIRRACNWITPMPMSRSTIRCTHSTGRYEVGKIGENDLLQSELALLRSRTTLDGAKLTYDRTLAAFRLAVNLAPGTEVNIAVTSDVPTFDAPIPRSPWPRRAQEQQYGQIARPAGCGRAAACD